MSTIDHIFYQIIHFKSPCYSYALFEVIRHLPDTLEALVCTLRKPSFTYLLPLILLRVPRDTLHLNGRSLLYVSYLPSECSRIDRLIRNILNKL